MNRTRACFCERKRRKRWKVSELLDALSPYHNDVKAPVFTFIVKY